MYMSSKLDLLRKKMAQEVIQRFMLKTNSLKKSRFLKTICSNSGVCIAFGTQDDKIHHFFNDFKNFDYAVETKKIGVNSVNGIITEIKYNHAEYVAYSVLKVAAKKNADNLMYEYLCGEYINEKVNPYLPCFVRTYGIHQMDSPKQSINVDDLHNMVNLEDFKYKMQRKIDISCDMSDLIGLNIQHLDGSVTLDSFMKNPHAKDFVVNELFNILFLVYHSLSNTSNKFTHYDLHCNNLLLFEPVKGSYIEYHIHGSKNKHVIKSSYLPKIIDYGRSTFPESQLVHSYACSSTYCKSCGNKQGYGWLDGCLNNPNGQKLNSYICPGKINVSHDLRLANIVSKRLETFHGHALFDNSVLASLYNILTKIVYDLTHGTPERNLNNTKASVYTVNGLYEELVSLLPHFQKTTYFDKMTKLGELHIYEYSASNMKKNKKMEFFPTSYEVSLPKSLFSTSMSTVNIPVIVKPPTRPQKLPKKQVIQTKKKCPPNKLINPLTNRCVTYKRYNQIKKTGPKNEFLSTTFLNAFKANHNVAPQPTLPVKNEPCPDKKIMNPHTGRCVDKNYLKKKHPSMVLAHPSIFNKVGVNNVVKAIKPVNKTIKTCPPGKILNTKTGRCVMEKYKAKYGLA